ncbi:MAG TPA: hypothetical protein VK973_04140 [Arenicellales bacterium]|nr:hypothetical protein [Arenicellales bacterium]
MAYTASDLAAVESAIARGETEVSFGDRSVKYRSIADLQRVRRAIKAELAEANSTPKLSPRYKLADFSDG